MCDTLLLGLAAAGARGAPVGGPLLGVLALVVLIVCAAFILQRPSNRR